MNSKLSFILNVAICSVITLALIMLFALFITFCPLPVVAVKIINQVIKVLVVVGGVLLTKNLKNNLLGGLIFGGAYGLITSGVFSLFGGGGIGILIDVLFCLTLGGIGGIVKNIITK